MNKLPGKKKRRFCSLVNLANLDIEKNLDISNTITASSFKLGRLIE